MKKRTKFLSFHNKHTERGSMLVELLLSVALMSLVVPFVFRYQHNAVVRSQNIAVTRQMDLIRDALERYIVENRETLLKTVGKSIVRLDISDLYEYGLNETSLPDISKYQLRILKSSDITGSATLQGVIVYSTPEDITPLRTREIVSLGGDNMGFVDGTSAYGSFGVWRANMTELGVSPGDAIIETTAVKRDNALYFWRVPSDSVSDSTMIAPLNLGDHDIIGAKYFDATSAQFSETLTANIGVTNETIFQNRTTIDSSYTAQTATVSGIMSSDGRSMEVLGNLALADLGKFSSFTTVDLWAGSLTLSGLTVDATDEDGDPIAAYLKINLALDMTSGRVSAVYTTVGFSGSITPHLTVYDRIEDSKNPEYFWEVSSGKAQFADLTLAELNRMAILAAYKERSSGTDATQLFSAVVANKNATASDYMIAIEEIQKRVRAKYRLLNLE
jgi:hypothetical protein